MSAGGMGGQAQQMGGGKGGMGMQQGPAAGGKGGMGMNRGPGGNAQNNPGGMGGPRPFGPGNFGPDMQVPPVSRPMPRPMPMPGSHRPPMTFAPPSPRKPVPMGGLLSNLYGNFGG